MDDTRSRSWLTPPHPGASAQARSPAEAAEPSEEEQTAALLLALASPIRLRILAALVRPLLVTELRIGGDRHLASPLAARQTIQTHVDKLVEVGLVETIEVVRAGRTCRAYVSRPQRIRAAKTALRDLADELDSRGRVAEDGTFVLDRSELLPGPQLIVIEGSRRSAPFALETNAGAPRRYVIGRLTGSDVAIPDDPYVSGINSYIEWIDDVLCVRDAPGSANGTTVNGARLSPGARALLRSGDVIGVGRTTVLFTIA